MSIQSPLYSSHHFNREHDKRDPSPTNIMDTPMKNECDAGSVNGDASGGEGEFGS